MRRGGRSTALGPARSAELLHVLMLPDFERADRIGEFWVYPESRAFAELLIDREEDRTLRAALVGMLRVADRNSLPMMKMRQGRGRWNVEIRRRFVFEEVVKNADDKVLARLKFVDRSGFVEEWVPLDQVSGLEPGARIELIEDVDAEMSPHIVRVDRGNSP